jgi:hypothetical protein
VPTPTLFIRYQGNSRTTLGQCIDATQVIKMRIGSIVATVVLAIGMAALGADESAKGPVTILIDRGADGVVYKVDGKIVPWANMADRMSRTKLAEGEREILVLIHEDNKLSTLIDTRGLLNMVGFSKIRYYYFDRQRRMMAAISLSAPAIPFSKSGVR